MYAGGMDALGQPYVARVYWSHRLKVSLRSVFIELLLTDFDQMGAADVFAGHLVSGHGLASSFYFPFDTESHGVIRHVRNFRITQSSKTSSIHE